MTFRTKNDVQVIYKKTGVIEYVNMHEVRKGLMNRVTGTLEEKEAQVEKIFSRGLRYKGKHLDIVSSDFYNPLWDRIYKWFYFVCPKCKNRAFSLFTIDSDVMCPKCRDKAIKKQPNNTYATRIMAIQEHFSKLLGQKKTSKQKNQLINRIAIHYNCLPPRLKPNSAFILEEFQKWCVRKLNSKNISSEYKQAMTDVLHSLRYIRIIMLRTQIGLKDMWGDVPVKEVGKKR